MGGCERGEGRHYFQNVQPVSERNGDYIALNCQIPFLSSDRKYPAKMNTKQKKKMQEVLFKAAAKHWGSYSFSTANKIFNLN